ncbi:MAG: tetratricopeptide repeat protein [Parachlamydia sp.]|nr:tetratricopeptide repeat protein [Parachlamydia sp.]
MRLGEAMRNLKGGNKALDHFQQAFEMFKKVHPAEHPDVAFAMAELGLAYSDVDDLQNGLAFLQEAEKIHQKLYPDGHPELAKNYYYLGLV